MQSLISNRGVFKKVVGIFSAFSLLSMSFAPITALAVNNNPPPTPASINITSISDSEGVHVSPFTFSCQTNPLFNPISISGNGAGSAPPGHIDQYHVRVDWGDGTIVDGLGTFTPPSGQGNFTFNFNSGSHSYTSNGNKTITVKLYHQTGNGNDNQIDSTISVPICVHVPPPTNGSITVTKIVSGGTAQVSDFNLKVGNTSVTSGVVADFLAGPYTISENSGPAGYSGVITGDCAANGNLTVVAGQHYDCTITNTFTTPPPTPGSLLVNKVAVGGNDTFNFTGNNISPFSITTIGGTGSSLISNLTAGSYTVTEGSLNTGWAQTNSTCNQVNVVSGQQASCTITNTFTPAPVLGCTNPSATNYNPLATEDDGSCVFPVLGCTNPIATNYNPNATQDDGSCTFPPEPVPGCTNPAAINYNPNATEDDGSCALPILGCTNPNAINYNPDATPGNADAQNCTFPPEPILGCTDSSAINFNPLATEDDDSCTYPVECDNGFHVVENACVPDTGSITVVKETNGGDGSFHFNGIDEGFTISTEEGSGSQTFEDLSIGSYTITENTQDNWTLDAVQCIYDDEATGQSVTNGEQVLIEDGDQVTCTFTNTFHAPEVPTQCSDGIDNDEDNKTDIADPACHTDKNADNSESYDPELNDESDDPLVCDQGFHVVENECVPDEVTPPTPDTTQCSDGIDNDGDGKVDVADPGCNGQQDNDETDQNSSNLGGGRHHDSGGSVLGVSTGQVLGESCGLYMDKFIRLGVNNDVEQVTKLQTFLNKHMNAGIPVSGAYGPATLSAVNAFQAKYASEILTPWKLTAPTGLVYQTTLRWINMLECPELALSIPELVEWDKNPNAPKLPFAVNSPAQPKIVPKPAGGDESTPVTPADDSDISDQDQSATAAASGVTGSFWSRLINKLFGK